MDKNIEFKIKDEERQSWKSIALVWTGSVISAPALMTGGIIGSGLSLGLCIVSIIIGYLIICTYMSFVGMQGCDTGLPTAVMASGALGEKGAKYVISTILAVACIGWFGIQAGVCGTSVAALLSEISGMKIPAGVMSAVFGILMLASACFRFNGLKKLNKIAVPILLIVFLLALYASLRDGGISVLENYSPMEHITMVEAIGLTVGHFAVAGAIAGDYCRFAKSRSDVVKSSFAGVIPAGTGILLMGAVLAIATGNSDISTVLAASGLPVLGLVSLVLASWTTNVSNAYSGGLSLAVLLGQNEEKSRVTTAIAGILGTLLAILGILGELRTFLSLLTALVPPLVGPMAADYWILHRGRVERFTVRPGFYMPGMIAFFCGAFTACATGGIFAKFSFLAFLDWPFFIGPVNGIVVAIVLYLVLNKLMYTKEVVK
ncbi:MAG: cytosine permease [Lachnospiraceae bacterium]|nr:cytosine permease [Lachnospiraceae bacterium]MDD3616730.1 cytosine permease [Lachnospiraceae bacterium]